jgi:hypothetical protein
MFYNKFRSGAGGIMIDNKLPRPGRQLEVVSGLTESWQHKMHRLI